MKKHRLSTQDVIDVLDCDAVLAFVLPVGVNEFRFAHDSVFQVIYMSICLLLNLLFFVFVKEKK